MPPFGCVAAPFGGFLFNLITMQKYQIKSGGFPVKSEDAQKSGDWFYAGEWAKAEEALAIEAERDALKKEVEVLKEELEALKEELKTQRAATEFE